MFYGEIAERKLPQTDKEKAKCVEEIFMKVHVVIVTKGNESNLYVYKNREDAIKLFCYYKDIGVNVALEEAEVQ